jgi:hypothetical protein
VNAARELITLKERREKLLREHAVLEAKETEKAHRREELRQLLIKDGVNPDDPVNELQRLEAETRVMLDKTAQALDEFEAKLKSINCGLSPIGDNSSEEVEEGIEL